MQALHGAVAADAVLLPRRTRPTRSLFLGDAGAGKTSLLEVLSSRLPSNKLRNPPPSTQPRAFDVVAGGRGFVAVDYPGAEKLRPWWAGALKEADGVVVACDSRRAARLCALLRDCAARWKQPSFAR